MKPKNILIAFLLSALIIGLFVWGNTLQTENLRLVRDTGVACLTNGHQRIAEHIHPVLIITVDGENEIVPADIGITPDCMPELHTHDTTGQIHAESFLPGRISEFNLSHFFAIWQKDYQREGFSLEMKQDGETKNSIEEIKMIDHSVIELSYTSI